MSFWEMNSKDFSNKEKRVFTWGLMIGSVFTVAVVAVILVLEKLDVI